jgi:endonuclease YncB( thermonuclease family)
LWVRPADGGPAVKLRIDGIDAPEICQAGGQAARKALAGRLLGRTVEVHTRGQDDYDRGLAVVSLDGEDVGAWMVSQGHAWAYRQRSGDYLALQARAQWAARGLFADRNALQPRHFRKQNGPCYP